MNGTPDIRDLDARTVRFQLEREGLPLKFWNELGSVARPDRLVKRLLGTTSFGLIVGEPACGKSFLATDLGMHIALGWNLGPGGDAQKVIEAATIVEQRTGMALQLVIIDTLARSMGAGDENSAQDMGAFIGACDRIRVGTGATVLVVHHRGKSQSGARGSSALLGAVDTAIEVERRGAGRVAKVTKQKDGADGEEFGFALEVVEVGTDDDDEPITTCIVRPTDEVAKAAPKLSPKHKRALDVLCNTLADHPEKRPNSVTLPTVTLTKVERFRKALESEGVTERNGERVQWQRIKESLCNKGLLRIKDDLCWIP
jgi:hypothetical protein